MTDQQPAQKPPKYLRFSTSGIVPDNRVQMWEGHNARALLPLDIRTIDDRPMQASETNLHLPSIRMASVFGTSQFVERSESFIADNPTGVIAIFFATEGDAVFFHRGGHVALRPGQAIVYDADRPFLRGFNNRFRELVLTIPKQRYREIVGSKSPELPAIFDFGATGNANEQALALLVQESLDRIERGEPRHIDSTEPLTKSWSGIETEALGLLHNVLGDSVSSEEGLISAAKNYIELNISDSGLSAAQISAAVGISERQLSRIFADADLTIGRYVLNTRLNFAKKALSIPERDNVPVSEIGKRFGFASPSHFSRTFRERFGMTPLQWRKESQRQFLRD
ncbi:AraC family transcriptional regulator [Corynebacterium crudilactis]|uniref:AraC family transcriptional regulator n=2 Tax=Corynebacterium crudilactis TaxID=1652495 RepID=A0A172QVY9_9CORY|nr:helix-turn-helix domain-containing protein [Corynebacterium crudilactis]ANE04859.1 AraC family transcriptional regulator [Corynebacterium crudilactis]